LLEVLEWLLVLQPALLTGHLHPLHLYLLHYHSAVPQPKVLLQMV
jgi:hypothetical protein